MLRDTVRITLVGLTFILAMASVVGGFFYTKMVSQAQEAQFASFASELSSGTRLMQQEVEGARRLLRFLQDSPSVRGLMRAEQGDGYDVIDLSTEQQWEARLLNNLLAAASVNPFISKICIYEITEGARELLRVERISSDLIIFGRDELSGRDLDPHVAAIRRQDGSEVYHGAIERIDARGRSSRRGELELSLGLPLRSVGGRMFGEIMIKLDVGVLIREIEEKLSDEAKLFLADSSGRILHSPDWPAGTEPGGSQPRVLQDRYPALEALIADPERGAFTGIVNAGSDAGEFLHAQHFLLQEDHSQQAYIAVIAIPNRFLTASARQAGAEVALVVIGFSLLSSGLLYYASWRFSRPIAELEAMARRIINGQPIETITWPQTSNAAVQRVSDAFARILAWLQDREQLVEEHRDRLATVLNGTEDAILLVNSTGIIETANGATREIFGYSEVELIGRHAAIFGGLDFKKIREMYVRDTLAKRAGAMPGQGYELQVRRKNGSDVDIRLRVSEVNHAGEHKFIAIITDITEVKAVSRVKAEFVATISHELRTPLTAIKGSLGLITTGAFGDLDQEGQDLVDSAYTNCSRLISLVNDILDIDKLAAGKMQFEFDTLDVSEVLEQSARECRGMAQGQGVTIELDLPESPAVVVGDQDRLVQVFNNLFSNAIKFSEPGETVTGSVLPALENWRISVSDNGPGIPESYHSQIFERFTQADTSTQRKARGTGLGLAISKAIVDAHDGVIDFATSPEGTTFYVDLTASQRQVVVLDTVEPHFTRCQVLICIDDPAMARLASSAIEGAGYQTFQAGTLAEAMGILESVTFDIVMIDWENRDHFAERLVQHLAQAPHLQGTCIVAMSLDQIEELDTRPELEASLLRYVHKPITREEIVRVVDSLTLSAGDMALRVLHVEDEPDHRDLFRSLMQGLATVIHAATMAEARGLLETERFDVVILDQHLPDGQGFSLIDMINRLPHAPQIMIFSIEMPSLETRRKVSSTLLKSDADNREILSQIKRLLRNARRRGETPEPQDETGGGGDGSSGRA